MVIRLLRTILPLVFLKPQAMQYNSTTDDPRKEAEQNRSQKLDRDVPELKALTSYSDSGVAFLAGVIATLVIGAGAYIVGWVGAGKARVLLESILPTSRFLCSAIITASSTILALMLTLVGMSANADVQLDEKFYKRIKLIAFFDMLVMIGATCFLMVHCIPMTKSDTIPYWVYPSAYYLLLGVAAILGGAMVFIVVLLYSTITDVIAIVGIGTTDHPLVSKPS